MRSINGVSRVAGFIGVLVLAVAAVVFGQAGSPAPPARSQMDELLVEVRAIRADLDRAASVSLRGQLLGMRLQLQEQRITALSRQLNDVQDRMRANQQAKVAMSSSLAMFNRQREEASPEERKQMEVIFGPLKQQLAGFDQTDADLKQQESALLGQLQEEQNRWTTFNGQIEELERSTASKPIR
jgi:hypothetical protein